MRKTTTSGLDWNVMLGLTKRLRNDNLLRDYLLITLGSYFGLRISDLLNLRWNDLLNKEDFLIIETKTNKERFISIHADVREALTYSYDQLKDSNLASDYIFANRWGDPLTVSYVNKRLKVILIKYNVKAQNPSSHTLRKTFGKHVFEMNNQSEKALIYLSEIFGHSSTAITRRYIGLTQEKIKNVYLNL
jgi:integrase